MMAVLLMMLSLRLLMRLLRLLLSPAGIAPAAEEEDTTHLHVRDMAHELLVAGHPFALVPLRESVRALLVYVLFSSPPPSPPLPPPHRPLLAAAVVAITTLAVAVGILTTTARLLLPQQHTRSFYALLLSTRSGCGGWACVRACGALRCAPGSWTASFARWPDATTS